jgi:hypothetical protein
VYDDKIYQAEIDPNQEGLQGIQEGHIMQPQQRAASHQRMAAEQAANKKSGKKQSKDDKRRQHIEHAAAHLAKMEALKNAEAQSEAAGSNVETSTIEKVQDETKSTDMNDKA